MGSRKKWITITAILLGAVLLFITSITLMKLMPARSTAEVNENAQTLTFPDGARLEILGTWVGTYTEDLSPRIKWPSFMVSKGSSTSSDAVFTTRTEEEDGKTSRVTMTTDSSPSALLLGIRFKDRLGYLKPQSYLLSNKTNHPSPVFQTQPPRVNLDLAPKDDSIATLIAEMNRVHLNLIIQYRDSSGEWINLAGPCPYESLTKNSCMLTLHAWERGSAMMDFRAVRATGEVLEFSLKNPDVRKATTTIVPIALPHEHKGAGYTATFRSVKAEYSLGNFRYSEVDMALENQGKSTRCSPMKVEDEWGNIVNSCASLPAASRKMRATYRVVRDESYPRLDSSGFMLAEGIVSEDGKLVRFTILPDGKRFGCPPMPDVNLTPFTESSSGKRSKKTNPYKDWSYMDVTVAVRIDSRAGIESIQNRIGPIEQCHYVVFPEGSNESAGALFGGLAGGGGKTETSIDRKTSRYWIMPPEMVKPGARLRIAIVPPIPDEYFTIDLPTH
ncbi:MAG: hypothetical protein QM644_17225 [Mobilitalea sp.]